MRHLNTLSKKLGMIPEKASCYDKPLRYIVLKLIDNAYRILNEKYF